MGNNVKNHKNAAKYIAYSGIIVACSIAVMIIGSYMTTAAYVCVAAASFLVFTISEECNMRYAFAAYICVSILGILFVPYKKIVWMFILLIGYYPLLKKQFDKIKTRILRVVVKLVLCDATMSLIFYATIKLMYLEELTNQFGQYAKIVLVLFIIGANIAFLCYDYALFKIWNFYGKYIRSRLGSGRESY